jgi:hypothetical protein
MQTLSLVYAWTLVHKATILGVISVVLWLIANYAPRPHPEDLVGWRKLLWTLVDRLCILTAADRPGAWKWLFLASPSRRLSAVKTTPPTTALIVLLALAGPVGCAAVLPILTEIVSAVVDAIPIIDAIEAFVGRHFSKHENTIEEAKARDSVARAREALVRSERNARLCEDDACVDAAWEPFRASYRELVTTVSSAPGVKVIVKAKASPDGAPAQRLLTSPTGVDLLLRDPLIMEPTGEAP